MNSEIVEIENNIVLRLSKTTQIYKELNEEVSTDVLSKVFISYYLDFSTAIEYITSQIINNKYNNDDFVLKKAASSKHTSMLMPAMINSLIKDIFPLNILWEDYKSFVNTNLHKIKQTDFPSNLSKNSIISLENFNSSYGTVYNIRNQIAHSFILQNINYNNRTLIDFSLSYFCLYKILIGLDK